MSGWFSATHPAPSPIPLGALRSGDGARRVGARPTEWMVLCRGVDLSADHDGLQLTRELCSLCRQRVGIFSLSHAHFRSPHAQDGAKFEVIVLPESWRVCPCNQTLEPRCTICVPLPFPFPREIQRILNSRVTGELLCAFGTSHWSSVVVAPP